MKDDPTPVPYGMRGPVVTYSRILTSRGWERMTKAAIYRHRTLMLAKIRGLWRDA